MHSGIDAFSTYHYQPHTVRPSDLGMNQLVPKPRRKTDVTYLVFGHPIKKGSRTTDHLIISQPQAGARYQRREHLFK